MHPLSRLPLPAHAAPAALPAQGPARGPVQVEPITVIEHNGPGLGRATNAADRRADLSPLLPQEREGHAIQALSLVPDAAGGDRGPEGVGSIWFRAQIYAQRSGPSQSAAMDGPRDAPQIGAAAYRRAAAESQIERHQPVLFRFAV